MSSAYDNLSLSDLKNINPDIGKAIEKLLPPRSYTEWVKSLYEDIDDILKKHITPSSSYRHLDKEDRFNLDLAAFLKERGYNASHDTWENGHSDIVVTRDLPSKQFKWCGETKIHKDYNYLLEGYKQLSSRYSSGLEDENHGAVIVINRNKNLKSVMEHWRNYLPENGQGYYKELKVRDCPINEIAFISSHKHEKSGLKYTVRHIPVSVYFKPIDKSSKKTKN